MIVPLLATVSKMDSVSRRIPSLPTRKKHFHGAANNIPRTRLRHFEGDDNDMHDDDVVELIHKLINVVIFLRFNSRTTFDISRRGAFTRKLMASSL